MNQSNLHRFLASVPSLRLRSTKIHPQSSQAISIYGAVDLWGLMADALLRVLAAIKE
jgi:hypothetical protein